MPLDAAASADRILVTGATGFVGRRLCSALLEQGRRPIAVVRPASDLTVLPPHIETMEVDEVGPDTDWNARRFEHVDAVVHLAARVHVMRDRSTDPAAEFHRTNVAGSERLARAAAGSVRRFVYVSSLHAMCTLSETRVTEDSPAAPDTPYGQSKLEAERRIADVAIETGMEHVVLRPPPVYGAGQLGNLMRLFRAVERGWPLPLGGIQNRRSLISVDNLVDALIACCDRSLDTRRESNEKGKDRRVKRCRNVEDAASILADAGSVAHDSYSFSKPNDPISDAAFLLSDGCDVSISELIERTAAAIGRKPRLLPAPVRMMKLAGRFTGRSASIERILGSLYVDDSKFRRRLNWTPRQTLDEGLAAAVRRQASEFPANASRTIRAAIASKRNVSTQPDRSAA